MAAAAAAAGPCNVAGTAPRGPFPEAGGGAANTGRRREKQVSAVEGSSGSREDHRTVVEDGHELIFGHDAMVALVVMVVPGHDHARSGAGVRGKGPTRGWLVLICCLTPPLCPSESLLTLRSLADLFCQRWSGRKSR